jgi:pimeloyl-ACP methyl ester carboxylesterase
MTIENTETQFLQLENNVTLAYHHSPGSTPGVMFLGGFKSDMMGSKALALDAWCKEQGRAFLRFDYQGHGQSSGEFTEGTIGQWADDAIAALDNLTDGPQILVGSSMGGWIMLLTALQRKSRIVGLLGLAAAPDFTEDLMWDAFSDDDRATIEQTGKLEIPNCYDDQEPYVISGKLIEEGRKQLLLRSGLDLDMPVRLIQGMQDEDVPHATAQRISDQLISTDVEVQIIKDGDHRLSRPHDLDRLCRTLDGLIHNLENPPEPVD